jgi:hypothetical protein
MNPYETAQRLAEMRQELKMCRFYLQWVTEQPHYKSNFTEGEQGSINALIATSVLKLQVYKHLEEGFKI